MTPEGRILTAIVRRLTADGWLVVKLRGSSTMSVAGLPDIMALRDGRTIFLEVKTSSGKASPLQEEWLRRLRARGFTAEVVRSVDEAIQVTAAPAAGSESNE